jgi:E3 ubiquitin-protein ligase HUWE1
MVKNNPSLLSGSFSILVHNPKVLEFENKRSYFFSVSDASLCFAERSC